MATQESDTRAQPFWTEMESRGEDLSDGSVIVPETSGFQEVERKQQPHAIDDQETVFKERHIQMMALGISPHFHFSTNALGSAMASGLFVSSSKVLYNAGPISMLLAFILMSTVAYAVLVHPPLAAC
jgi:amino acid permease